MPGLLAAVLAGVCLAGGCASRTDRGDASFVIDAAEYRQAFTIARDVLRDHRYEPDRVDAQAGVITTAPREGAGLLAAWTIASASTAAEDTINPHRRTAEIRFEPAEDRSAPPEGAADALARPGLRRSPSEAEGPVVVSVRVLVSRRVRPTRRLETSAIGYSSTSTNSELFRRGLGTSYDAPRSLDGRAARVLARAIRDRLVDSQTEFAPPP